MTFSHQEARAAGNHARGLVDRAASLRAHNEALKTSNVVPLKYEDRTQLRVAIREAELMIARLRSEAAQTIRSMRRQPGFWAGYYGLRRVA